MTLKHTLKQPLVGAVAHLPDSVQQALFVPWVRRIATRVPILRAVYFGCFRRHPIDLQYGTDTSGFVDAEALQSDAKLARQLRPYMGSQPSIIRRALQALGDVDGYTFIDIGCGKGRPMLIATEHPFDAILGYDISAELVKIANDNAAVIARRFPGRAPMRAFEANVSEMVFPAGKLVLFLYNPFGAEIVAAMLRNLEAACASGAIEHLFVVYDNPVAGAVFDGSTQLKRWFAATFPYEPGELGYGPGAEESVVIWQSVRGARPDVFANRNRPIVPKDSLSALIR